MLAGLAPLIPMLPPVCVINEDSRLQLVVNMAMEVAVAKPLLVTLGQGASGCGDDAVPDAAPAWLPGWAVVDAGESAAPPAGTTNVGEPASA